MLGNFSCFCCRLLIFFKTTFFSKNSFRKTIYHSVGPDLGSRCLQRLSADDESLIKTFLLSGDLLNANSLQNVGLSDGIHEILL